MTRNCKKPSDVFLFWISSQTGFLYNRSTVYNPQYSNFVFTLKHFLLSLTVHIALYSAQCAARQIFYDVTLRYTTDAILSAYFYLSILSFQYRTSTYPHVSLRSVYVSLCSICRSLSPMYAQMTGITHCRFIAFAQFRTWTAPDPQIHHDTSV